MRLDLRIYLCALAAVTSLIAAGVYAARGDVPSDAGPSEPAAIAHEALSGSEDVAAGTALVQLMPGVDAEEEIKWFNGRPIRPVQTIAMRVTAYSPDARSCGEFADGITASGYSVRTNGGKLVAADTELLPFGTMLTIPGYDAEVVPVLDRGGAIKNHRLDVLYPTHEEALQWGVHELEVTVWEYADGLPDDFTPVF